MKNFLSSMTVEQVLNKIKTNYEIPSYDQILLEYTNTINYGANFLFAIDPEFPENIYASCLIYKGSLDVLKNKVIGIVGARDLSIESDIFCRKLLMNQRAITVSGLAKGVDTIVHELSHQTIAVLATGINKYYPQINTNLQNNIAKNGLLITALPYGTSAKSFYFIARNRIIAALADSLIVIEATLKSGSLSTAKFAFQQNKPVYTVPGHPLQHRYNGNNMLISIGAHIMLNSRLP